MIIFYFLDCHGLECSHHFNHCQWIYVSNFDLPSFSQQSIALSAGNMANNIKMEWKEISVRAMSIIESHIGSSSASSDAISQLRDLIAAALANESTTATNNDTDIKKDTKSPPIFTAVHQAIIDALWFCGTQVWTGH